MSRMDILEVPFRRLDHAGHFVEQGICFGCFGNLPGSKASADLALFSCGSGSVQAFRLQPPALFGILAGIGGNLPTHSYIHMTTDISVWGRAPVCRATVANMPGQPKRNSAEVRPYKSRFNILIS